MRLQKTFASHHYLSGYRIKLKKGYLMKSSAGFYKTTTKPLAPIYTIKELVKFVRDNEWKRKWTYLIYDFERVANPAFLDKLPKLRNKPEREEKYKNMLQNRIDSAKLKIAEELSNYKRDRINYRLRIKRLKENAASSYKDLRSKLKTFQEQLNAYSK